MIDAADASTPPGGAADAGTWLRHGREQAGMSIDAVAQQLKLAPRQVKALEDSNFAELPGRTFVRGFMRNYARLLKLDPDAVVAALPNSDAAPALEGPSIGSSSRPMGELPISPASRGASWSRWAIPVALAAAVIVAAVYEFMRPVDSVRPESKGVVKPLPVEPAGGMPLPNPVTGATPAGVLVPHADEAPRPQGQESALSTAAAAVAPADAPAIPAVVAPQAPVSGDATLVIRYRESAWTQVRDAAGQTILLTNGQRGGSETVSGKPPLDLILGNAAVATIVWRGQPFDLAPHTRANVARVRLP